MDPQSPNEQAYTQQPPQAPIPPIENSNRSFWKTIAIGMSIVSFCITLAVGGYLLGVSKNKTAEAPTSLATATPTPTPTPDETANWKTYKGSSFSISYPPEFNATENGSETEFRQENTNTGVCTFIRISMVDSSEIENILATAKTKSGTLSPIPQIKYSYVNSVNKNITGFWIESGSENILKDVFILNGTQYVRYTFGGCSGAGDNYADHADLEKITDMAISTFKFTP